MAVQFGDASLQAGQEPQQVGLIHRSGLVQTEQRIRPDNAGRAQLLLRAPGQTGKDERLPAFAKCGARIKRQATGQIFPGQPHGPDAILLGQIQQAVQDDGMQVHIDVPINVGQRQTGGQKAFDLRPAFVPDLRPSAGREEVAQSGPGWIMEKISAAIGQLWEVVG